MKSHAIFLVNVRPGAVANPLEELMQISGIYRVEEVAGVYDFLVEVETTARLTHISDKLMAKPWVKRVHVLRPIHGEDSRPENSSSPNLSPDNTGETDERRLMPAKSWIYPTL